MKHHCDRPMKGRVRVRPPRPYTGQLRPAADFLRILDAAKADLEAAMLDGKGQKRRMGQPKQYAKGMTREATP
ncbi:hypothetical protein BH11GEM2_BH11GEM2_38220 [soil metagenome]